jgi:nitrite reductase/ring-hydroxylating ferredoxin subunit
MVEKVALCQTDTLAPGEMVRFELEGMDPMLLVNDDGTYRLIDDDCTHAIASLADGRLEGHIIFCPLHGGSFDIRTGKACSLPCKHALRTYPTAVEGGTIYFLG